MVKTSKFSLIIFILLLIGSFAVPLHAVKPRSSTHKTRGQFERGILHDTSILFKGIITLAPQKFKVLTSGDPYIWSIVSDSKDNIYIGTGNDGTVYQVTAHGDTGIFFDSDELEVFALAIDSRDNLYAATSPNGQVYKIAPDGSRSVFFNPEDKYIWAMVFDAQNNLYVATGLSARIYKITADGASSTVLQSEQAHIRCLYYLNNTLYAGSSGNGYVYKLEPGAKPVVLFDTQMQEVDEIVVAANGNVYAAAFGEAEADIQARKAKKQKSEGESPGDEEGVNEEALEAQSIILENIAQTPTSLFIIEKNGYSRDLWRGADERIQSLALHRDGDILLGTGDDGKLYKINADGDASLLLQLYESQITTITPAKNGQYYLGSSNLGSVYLVKPESVSSASFESETIDAGLPSSWGSLTWEGQKNDGQLEFYTRSGNTEKPEQSWNLWVKAVGEGNALQIVSPPARFIQWRCELKSGKTNPMLEIVTISYMQKNLPPAISDIIVHRPGDYYENSEPDQKEKGLAYPQNPPKAEYKQGYRSIDWLFEDPNFDGVRFDLYYKNTTHKSWKALTRQLAGSYYTWDSRQMADGEYLIKIIGNDSATNPANLALTGEKICDKFIIDNSGPQITGLQDKAGKFLFQVEDKWNIVKNVYYSIDAGDWKAIFPVDNMCDTKQESFELLVSQTSECEIAVKAEDAIENITVIHYQYKQ